MQLVCHFLRIKSQAHQEHTHQAMVHHGCHGYRDDSNWTPFGLLGPDVRGRIRSSNLNTPKLNGYSRLAGNRILLLPSWPPASKPLDQINIQKLSINLLPLLILRTEENLHHLEDEMLPFCICEVVEDFLHQCCHYSNTQEDHSMCQVHPLYDNVAQPILRNGSNPLPSPLVSNTALPSKSLAC